MSQWHRDNPELVGTPADPWTIHDDYVQALRGERPWDGLDFEDALEVLSEAALTSATARTQASEEAK